MRRVAFVPATDIRCLPGDVAVSDIVQAGVPAESVVRTAKIATIEAAETARIGALPTADRAEVRALVSDTLEGLSHTEETYER